MPSSNKRYNEACRCLGDAFAELMKIHDAPAFVDRKQLAKVLLFVTKASDELAILLRGKP